MKTYTAMDASTRELNATLSIPTMDPAILTILQQGYKNDSYFASLLEALRMPNKMDSKI